jgi:hypothetical protein
MESNWAAEHLQVIRTLMERSALYRRALAPIMIFNGVVGLAAAALGWGLKVGSAHAFILYWASVSAVAMTGSFLLVRRQAIKDSEPFWSPPTRRVSQAFLPPLAAGLMISAAVLVNPGSAAEVAGGLPLLWLVLYGCAFHAAGFFISGCVLFAVGTPAWARPLDYAHGIMGLFFGGLHLAYGVYLYFTEHRRNET